MDFTKAKKAFLVLADGTVFEGKSFGAEGTVFGEVVFTTSMVGDIDRSLLSGTDGCSDISSYRKLRNK